MKRLLIVRHAKSSWSDSTLDDRERPLNKRGKRDSEVMGRELAKRGFIPDLIVSSPAKRALKTAVNIARRVGASPRKIERNEIMYSSGIEGILGMIRKLDDGIRTAIVVGHNPDITALANRLGDFRIDNVPTCGMVCFNFEGRKWQKAIDSGGKMAFYEFPKKTMKQE